MFKIFCPSYRRADKVLTHKYIDSVVYVVAESEAEKYISAGLNVWVVPDSAQGNLCRVRNYILDHADVRKILILDDDLRSIHRWVDRKGKRLKGSEAVEMIESGFNIADEMGVKFWGLNCNDDKGAYREYTPFSFSAYIGGPFQAHIENPCRYDERLPLKEDYDMTLQVLNRFRKILRFNFLYYVCDQHGLPGGCATYRTLSREKKQFELLEKKWGPEIVKRDSGATKKMYAKRKNRYDINPIIKIFVYILKDKISQKISSIK